MRKCWKLKMSRFVGYVWQALSFLLVIYGFYLFFLFTLDTLIRISRTLALPLSLLLTFVLIAFVGIFWYKKRRLPL